MTALANLTPAMRACLGTGRESSGLAGLYHGSTLAALHRLGLVDRAWDTGLRAHEYRLNAAGLAVRDDLRNRVNGKLADLGFCLHKDSTLFTRAGDPVTHTRTGAMRATGVKW